MKKSSLRAFFTFLPLLLFSLPMGLGNAGIGAIGILAALPLIALSINSRIALALPILLSAVATSIVNGAYSDYTSSFQAFRTGIPFAIICTIIACHRGVFRTFQKGIRHFGTRFSENIISIFAYGMFLQLALLKLGINLANTTLGNVRDSEIFRVFVFPLSASLLVFLHCLRTGRYVLAGMLGTVLLLSGSKIVLVIILLLLLLVAIDLFKQNSSFKKISFVAFAPATVITTILINPTAVDRLIEFSAGDRFIDSNRSLQIEYAKETILSDIGHFLLGTGFTVPVKPPEQTTDPRWFENSMFDIENGYWMLLAKIGLIGVIFFGWLFTRIKFDFYSAGALIVALVTSIGSGSIFFHADGVYLLIWMIFFRAATEVAITGPSTALKQRSRMRLTSESRITK